MDPTINVRESTEVHPPIGDPTGPRRPAGTPAGHDTYDPHTLESARGFRECADIFANAIQDGTAALFLGAGMSREVGFVDWRELLRDLAHEIDLDIDRETDYPAVVQYYLNERQHDRGRLNQVIMNAFGRRASKGTANHAIIARLPISTIWTTNFDAVLEDALQAAGRIPDVKRRDVDFSIVRPNRDVTVYKMHGDISEPDRVVISRDDYERYALEHPLFQRALEGDLVTKTILFLGLSFTDPNLRYVLGHLRALLKNNKREHFAVMRRARFDVHLPEQRAWAEFDYNVRKQTLQVEDLKRYGIRTILVDQHSHVTSLLKEIDQAVYGKQVFVSGSAHTFGAFDEDRMRNFCMLFGEELIKRRFTVVTGMGLNIGDALIKGALTKLHEQGERAIEKHLCLRPFPRSLPAGIDEAVYLRQYRASMIERSRFAVFIAGTSRTQAISRGVMQEYGVVRELDRVPIPVGVTGFAAAHIWEEISKNLKAVYRRAVSREMFNRLNDASLSNEEIVEAVFAIIDAVSRTRGSSRPRVLADAGARPGDEAGRA